MRLHLFLQRCERGDQRVDLGPGAQDYKYRLADSEDLLEWVTLVPPGRRYVLGRAALSPVQLRYAVTQRLTPEQKEKLRGAVARVRRTVTRPS